MARLFRPVHQALGADLKYLVSGGAALDPALARFWDHLGFLTLQGYGLTETTSAVACERVDARRFGSVGKVLPGQEVRLAANHQSYLDPAVIAMALPRHLRRQTAVAAWAEHFEAPGRSWPVRLLRRLADFGAVLLVDAFPLPQGRVFRPSLQYMGASSRTVAAC